MTITSKLLVVAMTLALALNLMAHGNIVTPSPKYTGSGTLPAPRVGTGSPSNPAPIGSGSRLPSGGGATTGASASSGTVVRGRSGRTGARTQGAETPGAVALEGWEPWWDQNKDRFLDLRSRLSRNSNVSGSPGLLTGRGRKISWRNSQRVDADMVDTLIVPALISVIAENDDRDILDSSVLALARSAPAHQASAVLDALIPLLSHRELSVQSSAALSLGVLGSNDAAELLLSLARDDSAGRAAIGGGPVPRQVRAPAAFALGLVADARSVYRMLNLLKRLPAAERDVKASAVAGLGMLSADHAQLDVVQTVLVELLADKRLDPMVKSYLPTTLAKLGRRSALPSLLHTLADRDSDHPVRQSIVLAAGRLATLEDVFVVEALVNEVTQGRDRLTRHFALMSLAQMGCNGTWGTVHAELARLLGRELSGNGKSREHRSWAALAAAILGRGQLNARALLTDRLRVAYADERDPSYKGAFALALGLLHDVPSAEMIHEDFSELADQSFRGHAALALGFLDRIESSDELRSLCINRATPDGLRLSAAMALGLLGDRTTVPVLVSTLQQTGSLAVRAALATALGLIGDRSAVQPLLDMAANEDVADQSRAFACVAVGLLAERTSLPFNEPLKADGNYLVPVDSIQEILAIL
jgi:HEAT repeat protein